MVGRLSHPKSATFSWFFSKLTRAAVLDISPSYTHSYAHTQTHTHTITTCERPKPLRSPSSRIFCFLYCGFSAARSDELITIIRLFIIHSMWGKILLGSFKVDHWVYSPSKWFTIIKVKFKCFSLTMDYMSDWLWRDKTLSLCYVKRHYVWAF